MPAVSEAVPLGPLQLVIWAVVLTAAVACTVIALRHHAGKPDADGRCHRLGNHENFLGAGAEGGVADRALLHFGDP